MTSNEVVETLRAKFHAGEMQTKIYRSFEFLSTEFGIAGDLRCGVRWRWVWENTSRTAGLITITTSAGTIRLKIKDDFDEWRYMGKVSDEALAQFLLVFQ